MALSYYALTNNRAVENMAMDHAMLEAIDSHYSAFRAYGWIESSFTFGYTQRIKEVKSIIGKRETALIRRPTGGGIVNHLNDWTYALSVGASHDLAGKKPLEIAEWCHQWLAKSICRSGVSVMCYDPEVSEVNYPKACFDSPSPYDVVLESNGMKVAGVALKRTRKGILLQGSVDRGLLAGIDFSELEQVFVSNLASGLALDVKTVDTDWIKKDPYLELLERYGSERWNNKR